MSEYPATNELFSLDILVFTGLAHLRPVFSALWRRAPSLGPPWRMAAGTTGTPGPLTGFRTSVYFSAVRVSDRSRSIRKRCTIPYFSVALHALQAITTVANTIGCIQATAFQRELALESLLS